ncbi:AvrD family protein [Kitasatospora sp. NPDC056446]|uniref:AvrD family protein n=1 Tax=Kitasatospora sp. NPDC056446 TaxID=3345819 RepID=UPI0036B82C54
MTDTTDTSDTADTTGTAGTAEQTRPDRVTVDDYLGPGEKRFFGEGYKRARQRLTDVRVGPGPDGTATVTALATVRYPDDWSKKGKRNQRPHLSSIDVLLLAGEAAEVYLAHVLGLDAGQRAAARLRRVRMKAGTSPVEEDLDLFPVEAAVSELPGASGDPRVRVSVADCRVGALRVRLEIEHPAGATRTGPGSYADPDELLGSAALRPYGTAHQAKYQVIEGLAVDFPANSAAATVSSRFRSDEDLPVRGLESYSHRATSILDAFVATIQLGQILLYEIDGVPRSASNTLWMRQTVLDIGDPHQPVTEPERLTVHLDETELLTSREGETWRLVDIVGAFRHMSVRCSAAHRLP